MKVLKIFGKIVAVLLGIILFTFEISYAVTGPVTDMAAEVITKPEKVIQNIDIDELLEQADEGVAKAYDEVVDQISAAINISKEDAKQLINSEPVKEALGKIMNSVVKVALGDETAKMSNQEITDVVYEAASKVIDEMEGYFLPENVKEYIGDMIEDIGIDNLYDKLKEAIGPTSFNVEDIKLLSEEDGALLGSSNNIDYTEIIKQLANKTIAKFFITAIAILVLLIFVCQWSIFGGFLEVGIVTLLSSIVPFIIYAGKDVVGIAAKDAGLPIDISTILNFKAYLTYGYVFAGIGIGCIIIAIVVKTIGKSKKNNPEQVENA